MKVKDINKIACIGAGTIGASWATLYLWKGFVTTVQSRRETSVEAARKLITSNLEFLCKKEIITQEELENALSKAIYTTNLEEALDGVQFIHESASETYEVKRDILEVADRLVPKAIFASSTSGLLISEIQKNSKFPERCITAHPFNPPHLIPLVELVKGEQTSEETVQLCYDFYKELGREPIIINKEVPGHVASRIQLALWRECADLVLNGVCSVQDVDLACCYGPGLRWALMGPHLIWDLSNPQGISATLDHIGPSMDGWLPDMADWHKIPKNSGEVISAGLKEEIGDRTHDEIKAWRDDKLIEILKLVDKI